MPFDSRCAELAEVFLAEHPDWLTEENLDELAQAIQDTIELFLQDLEDASAAS